MQLALTEGADVNAVKKHLTGAHVVKTGDEVDKGCFSAACCADYCGDLVFFGGKGDIGKNVVFRVRITERNVFEFNGTLVFLFDCNACFRILDCRLKVKHLVDSFCGDVGSRNNDEH